MEFSEVSDSEDEAHCVHGAICAARNVRRRQVQVQA